MRTDKPTKTASAPETRTVTHVNTGKPAGIRETQNEQDNREARTIPAEKPTAIHTEDVLDDGPDGFEREDGSETQYGSVESERDAYKAHAAQLAEALRILMTGMPEQQPWAESHARAVLERWENAQ